MRLTRMHTFLFGDLPSALIDVMLKILDILYLMHETVQYQFSHTLYNLIVILNCSPLNFINSFLDTFTVSITLNYKLLMLVLVRNFYIR